MIVIVLYYKRFFKLFAIIDYDYDCFTNKKKINRLRNRFCNLNRFQNNHTSLEKAIKKFMK